MREKPLVHGVDTLLMRGDECLHFLLGEMLTIAFMVRAAHLVEVPFQNGKAGSWKSDAKGADPALPHTDFPESAREAS